MTDAATSTSRGKRNGEHAGHDNWILWFPFVVVGVAFFLALVARLPGELSILIIPLIVLGRPIAIVSILIMAGIQFRRGKPRKGISLSAAVLLTIVLWEPVGRAAEFAHVVLTTQFGLGQLGSSVKTKDNRLEFYDWSVGFVSGGNTFLVYDSIDEIALPLAERKHPVSSDMGLYEECAGQVRHLFGHYYVCYF